MGDVARGAVEMGVIGDSGRREAQTSAWTWGLFHAALAVSAAATALVVVMLEPRLHDVEGLRSLEGAAAMAAVAVVLGGAMGIGGLIVRASRGLAYECSIRRGVIPDLVAGGWLLAIPILAIVVTATSRAWTVPGAGLLGFYLAWVWGVSVVAFIAYGADKHIAVERGWGRMGVGHRIPERVLQGFALLGGAPGSILAQRVFHHKTSIEKGGFRAKVWLLAVVHYVAVAVLAFVWVNRGG
jgi:uncharacterized membrane protein YsdA (DUF1294 family)